MAGHGADHHHRHPRQDGVLDAAGVNELAELPSKEQLIGRVLGSIQSSLYSLAYVLQAIVDKDGGTEAA